MATWQLNVQVTGLEDLRQLRAEMNALTADEKFDSKKQDQYPALINGRITALKAQIVAEEELQGVLITNEKLIEDWMVQQKKLGDISKMTQAQYKDANTMLNEKTALEKIAKQTGWDLTEMVGDQTRKEQILSDVRANVGEGGMKKYVENLKQEEVQLIANSEAFRLYSERARQPFSPEVGPTGEKDIDFMEDWEMEANNAAHMETNKIQTESNKLASQYLGNTKDISEEMADLTESEAEHNAMLDIENALIEDANIQGEKNSAVLAHQSRQLTRLSIALFVTQLIYSQFVGVLAKVAKGNKVAERTFKNMQTGITAMIGPLQMYTTAQLMAKAAGEDLWKTQLKIAGAMLGMFLISLGMNKELGVLRYAFIALGVALVAFQAIQLLGIKIDYAKIAANLGKLASQPPPANLIMLGIAGAALASVAGIMTTFKARNRGQTSEGFYRNIDTTGPIIAHRGEKIGRFGTVSSTQPMSGGTNNININISSGALVSEPLIRQLGNEISRKVSKGEYRSSRTTRRVIVG
jgi:hypothetical protein